MFLDNCYKVNSEVLIICYFYVIVNVEEEKLFEVLFELNFLDDIISVNWNILVYI